MKPRVSIVCVTWNSKKYIERCLQAIAAQTHRNYEIILVDNNSQDGLGEYVTQHFPQIRLIANKENLGFCKATNQGIATAQSEFILILNPDVLPEPTFLEELVAFLSLKKSYGSVGGKLLLIKNEKPSQFIDSAGLMLSRTFRARDRGNMMIDRAQYDREEDVFALCGAAALFRRDALERIKVAGEYLDEDFFAYYDDLDIGWRLQLAGYESGYTPKAVAYHVRGGSGLGVKFSQKTRAIQRITLRNRYFMLLKNLSVENLIYFLPYLLVTEFTALFYILTRAPHLLAVYTDVQRNLAKVMRKRAVIQVSRKNPPRYIRSWVKRGPLQPSGN